MGEGGTEGKDKAGHELPEGDTASALGVGDRGDQRDAHALITAVLWDCIELFLKGPCQ